ncbi:MAG: TetR family transcriptional regulator C-terminal domain-containing protein [Alphaproteobacteria bacterium]|nr:TetR family transcriptional regulator C-terminal domain-containing protein [Alphaproteobacteria bacterium]
MTPSNTARAGQTRKRTRIQVENEEKILDGALEIFSRFGYRGATVDQIAAASGMSKPNLLYYFRRKHDIYVAVLRRTLEMWLQPLEEIDADGDPAGELSRYIAKKLEFSRTNPQESRLFASEIIQGAPQLRGVLAGQVHDLVESKAEVLRTWAKQGKIIDVDPFHLIFMIWATTQHYADFESQIEAVLPGRDRNEIIEEAYAPLTDIFLRGILPR